MRERRGAERHCAGQLSRRDVASSDGTPLGAMVCWRPVALSFFPSLHLEPTVKTPSSADPAFGSSNGNAASQAASRVTEVGQTAVDAIDEKREGVARGIDSAASTLREKADSLPGGEQVARAAHTAADVMERTAGYMRDQDVRAMLSDARQIVAKHPGAALLGAVAAGFLLARSLKRH